MKKTLRVQFLFFLVVLVCYPVYISASEVNFTDKLWLEIAGNSKYMKTGFNRETNDGTLENYYPFRLRVNAGLRHNFNEEWFFDLYLHTGLKHDFGNEEWNNVSWRNSYTWAPTARIGYSYSEYDNEKSKEIWLQELSVNFFTAFENLESSLDSGKDEISADETYTENVRVGIDSYIAASSKRHGDIEFWLELWSELAYNDTALSEKPNKDYYIFQTAPTIGMSWFIGRMAIQPYVQCYLAWDLGSEEYNKVPWYNMVEYGPGIRLSLGKFIPIDNASLYIFGRLVWVDYFDRVDPEQYEGTADDDFRVGVEFRLPFGAIKDFLVTH